MIRFMVIGCACQRIVRPLAKGDRSIISEGDGTLASSNRKGRMSSRSPFSPRTLRLMRSDHSSSYMVCDHHEHPGATDNISIHREGGLRRHQYP